MNCSVLNELVVKEMLVLLLFLAAAHVSVGQLNPNCDGKQVIVHLFEWKWTDIAAECERFLGPAGYCGLQVSPPTDHIVVTGENVSHPWWQRYQPVTYDLTSRSGTAAEFAEMVRRCNNVGVRTYVDVVLNHLTARDKRGFSFGGKFFDAAGFYFPNFIFTDFTPREYCPSTSGDVDDYMNPENVRNCYLLGLLDLYGNSTVVRNKQIEYLNQLVDLGVAGVRVDAAKHMYPEVLASIFSEVKMLPIEHGFPADSRLFVFQEVTDIDDEAVTINEYFGTGMVTEFRYGRNMAKGIHNFSELTNLVDYQSNMAPTTYALVFVDNHDNQRGHGANSEVITHKTPRLYKQAVSYMLAYPYGFTRVMSSYFFNNTDEGPPSDENYQTDNVTINDDGSCGGGWVCEHRWKIISEMVRFRNFASGAAIINEWNNGEAAAFTREGKCFFAMSQNAGFSMPLNTGLPSGNYCNFIDDCSTIITVQEDGTAQIIIESEEEPIVAICVGNGTDTSPTETSTTSYESTTPDFEQDYKRTVIVMQKTVADQGLFLLGGLDGNRVSGCTQDATTSNCAIPISYNTLGESAHYDSLNFWSVGDTKLDWHGAESNQSSFIGIPALGTPTVATSNNPNDPGFQELNKWGDHYWMVDVDMDCSKVDNGWFEVQAITRLETEREIIQSVLCTGSAGGTTPYASTHHMGRCGYLNLFYFESGYCEIDHLDTSTTVVSDMTSSVTSTTEEISTSESATTEETTVSLPLETSTVEETTVGNYTSEVTTDVTQTTETSTIEPNDQFQRTVIFLYEASTFSQNLFIRGAAENRAFVTIPINVTELNGALPSTTHYDPYNAWRIGDDRLDWNGTQIGQGTYNNLPAQGTPLAWTTNDPLDPLDRYQELNKFGPSYWMVDLLMDCSKTFEGWFEFKGFLASGLGGNWEPTLPKPSTCVGTGGVPLPPALEMSENHVARCGYLNVFRWGETTCTIDEL